MQTIVPVQDRVFDLFADLEPDDVVTYDDLAEVLHCHPMADRQSMRIPVYRARRRLELERQRTIENVRNEGYRVVHAREHDRLAGKHQGRAHRQITFAKHRVTSTRRGELTQEECRLLDDRNARLDQIADVMERARRT